MKIAVCIKQVPDTEARLRVNKEGTWVEEGDLPFVINESDIYALEEGIALAEKTNGEVVVFSVGPARASEALRKALAMGAARAVHLQDDAFQGGDAMSTAKALAAAIAQEGAELVLTGSQSDDAGYGATGSVIASALDWPHAWLVMGLQVAEDAASCEVIREMEGGMNERFRLSLPAVIEVQAGINHPRYVSLKGIMQAKRKPINQMSPADLGLDATQVGAEGAGVEILSVAFPPTGEGAEILEGDPPTVAKQLVEKLRHEARVL